MPTSRYPVPPDLAALLRDMQRDIKNLQAKVANLGPQPVGSPVAAFDANVIWNGGCESGKTGWGRSFNTGTLGVTSVEAADPLDNLYSLRVDEQASSSTRIVWFGSGNASNAIPGDNVFATAPGEQWQIQALLRSTVDTTHAKIYGVCGTTPADCFGIFGAQTYVAAADVPLVAGTVTALSGLITVPATRNYVAFSVSPDDAAGSSGVPWSWWLDDVVLQRKL
jgi:hypothetical protein